MPLAGGRPSMSSATSALSDARPRGDLRPVVTNLNGGADAHPEPQGRAKGGPTWRDSRRLWAASTLGGAPVDFFPVSGDAVAGAKGISSTRSAT